MNEKTYFDSITPESIIPSLTREKEVCLPACTVGELIQKLSASNIKTSNFTGDHAYKIPEYLKQLDPSSVVATGHEKIGLFYTEKDIPVPTVIVAAKFQKEFRVFSLATACLIAHEVASNKKKYQGILWSDDSTYLGLSLVIFLKETDYEDRSDKPKGFYLELSLVSDAAHLSLEKISYGMSSEEKRFAF